MPARVIEQIEAETILAGGTPTDGDVLTRDASAATGAVWETPTAGGSAPATATYVTLTTDATLTSERTLAVGTGLSLTDGGAGSTVTIAPALDLAAVEALSTTGLAVRTGTSTWTTRTITTSGTGISISDGGGVAAAPVITVVPATLVAAGVAAVPRIAWTTSAIEFMATSAAGSNSTTTSLTTGQIRYILHFEEQGAGATYDAINAFSTTGGAGALTTFALYSGHSSTKKPDTLLWSCGTSAASGANTQYTITFASGTWTGAGASYKDGSDRLLTTYGMILWRAQLNTVGNVTFRCLSTTNVKNIGVDINGNGDYRGFSETVGSFQTTATPVVYTSPIPTLPLRWV